MSQPLIDRIDRKILSILQKDVRITNARLAEQVSLSPSACLARHRRLEELGVIAGYRADIATDRLRPRIRVIVEIRLRQHLPDDFRRVQQVLNQDRRVIEAVEVSGQVDYYASLCVRDMAELRDLIDSIIEKAPCIDSVKSSVVMHSAKDFVGFPID